MSRRKPRQIAAPPNLEKIRSRARQAIGAIKPVDDSTAASRDFLFTAQETNAGRALPPYYFVYFLLVDLLGFRNLGRFEKIAWSVPIDFRGQAFLIDHRKFGVGIFADDPPASESDAQEIVRLIKRGITVARPYFEWIAEQAVHGSKLNVMNHSGELFERYTFLRTTYDDKAADAVARKDEYTVEKMGAGVSYSYPAFDLRQQATWLALAAIDAFFSWTEHVFVHLGILAGKLTTGEDVAHAAEESWFSKFKLVLDLEDSTTKRLFDELGEIKNQLRNFVAHGAFGKNREAFHFHSKVGAVPVLLPNSARQRQLTLGEGLVFDDDQALETIESFINHIWSGDREPAEIYIQRSGLPLILSYASDGTYARAMTSVQEMQNFVDGLCRQFDDAANMDW